MGTGTLADPIIVDPDSGAGFDYTSLAAAISGEARNITGDAGPFYIECRCTGGTADGAATIDGFTTDATHWVDISAGAGYRHAGIYPSGNTYRNEATDTAGVITVRDDHVRLSFLSVKNTITPNNFGYGIYYLVLSAGSIQHIGNCVIKGSCAGTGTGYGIFINDADPTVYIYNNVVHDIVSGSDNGFRGVVNNGNATAYIYNNTVSNCYYGIYGSTNTTSVNNAVFNNADDFLGSFASIDHCASDDGDGTNAVDFDNEATDWALVFTDYSNGDFSLLNYTGAYKVIGMGTDNPGSGLYSDDIVETARTSTWDIGAFEYSAGAPPTGNPWYYYAQQQAVCTH